MATNNPLEDEFCIADLERDIKALFSDVCAEISVREYLSKALLMVNRDAVVACGFVLVKHWKQALREDAANN